ncbi:penicillin-binding protein [Spirochaetia bacterium]|nr:penicillin-binding protein [Spirochaetia bacterium]
MSASSFVNKRFIVFISLLSAAAVLVLVRYGIVMLRPLSPDQAATANQGFAQTSSAVRGSGRGRILDRNSRILALETRVGNVAVQKDKLDGPDREAQLQDMRSELVVLAGKLSPFLEIPAGDLLNQIMSAPTNFVYLKKQVSLPVIEAIESAGAEAAKTNRILKALKLDRTKGTLSVKKSEMPDREGLCEILGPALGLSSADLLNRIVSSSRNSVDLGTRMDISLMNRIELLINDAAVAEKSFQKLRLERGWGRIYPEHSLAGQVIGFVGDENSGLEGIEYQFERDLSPAVEGETGNSVVLTIDVNVQYILEEIARRALTENRAEAVMLLAMDPRNGDILGSASLPNFDPNNFNDFSGAQRKNLAASWDYEPGSVFKVFSMASLLDSGAIGSNTIFVCNGVYEGVDNRGRSFTINCLGAHGRVNVHDIIVYSCNAGAAYAADRMNKEAFNTRLRDLGFGSQTKAGNPGETAGLFWPVERWSERSKPTIAMGQELSVSALQMLQAASAVANNGLMVSPRIVSRIESPEGKIIRAYEADPPRQILRPETARAMRSYMVDVTSDIGTGWRANVEDLSLAVKTGTAQSSGANTRGYSSTDFIASCIALLPAESPSLILYIAIVRPRGEFLGGRIAAPPIREAAEALIDYLGIPRGRNPQTSHSGAITISGRLLPELKDTMPSFGGYSKKELSPLLLREDIKVEVYGDGWVRRQSPAPGSPVSAGTTITLELE